MKFFTIHGKGFTLGDVLLDRIEFLEHEALNEVKNNLVDKKDVEFISLGGIHNEKGIENSCVAYDFLKKEKDLIDYKSQIIHLGGRTFLEECVEVVNFINKKGLKKVSIFAAVENSPLRKHRLKFSYVIALNLFPYRKFFQKNKKIYLFLAPFLSIFALIKPLKNKIEIGYYQHGYQKNRPLKNAIISLLLEFFDPMNMGILKKLTDKDRK